MLRAALHVVELLAVGGVATSLAEYFLHYNLIDLIVDKAKALIGLEQSLASRLKAEVRAKLRVL